MGKKKYVLKINIIPNISNYAYDKESRKSYS